VWITLRNASVFFGTAAVMKMGDGAGGGSRSRWYKDYLMNGSQRVCNMVIGQLAYWVLRLIRFARVELLVLWAWFLSKVKYFHVCYECVFRDVHGFMLGYERLGVGAQITGSGL
jgi:hypothetical protein